MDARKKTAEERDAERVLKELGLRVIELRRAKKLTQEKLAEMMDVDARELRRLERGDNTTVRRLVSVARALKVPLMSLFEPPQVRWKRQPGRPEKEDES